MSARRKGESLSLTKKFVIVQRLKTGESPTKLSKIYNIPRTTINDMKRDADKIERYVSIIEMENGNVTKKKTMTRAAYDRLDTVMYQWFLQQSARGVSITGNAIKKKALYFNAQMKGNPTFKASDGWLDKFKNRHGIQLNQKRGRQKAEPPKKEVLDIIRNVKMAIKKHKLTREQIYNCDETGLFWKSLPLDVKSPKSEGRNERITLMACANATGRHRLPLVAIGKPKHCITDKGVQDVPIQYHVKKNGWMNRDIFYKWFETTFIPSVKEFLKQRGLKEKALLLLDDIPSHPDWNEHENTCSLFFLPVKTANLVQPMKKGIIDDFKYTYRKKVLECVKEANGDMEKFSDEYTLQNAFANMADAWQDVPKRTFRSSWCRILRRGRKNKDALQTNGESKEVGLLKMCADIPGLQNMIENDIKVWLESDKHDSGYEIMNDNEIIENVRESNGYCDDVRLSEPTTMDDIVKTENEVKLEPGVTISHFEAEDMLSKCIHWLQSQEEADSRNIVQLKKILNLARSKTRVKNEEEEDI